MSIIGTGPAAGVAQTTHQARQIAHRRDREDVRSIAEAKRLREMLEAHMLALEEGDGFESPSQLLIDGDVQDERRSAADQQPQSSEPVDDDGSQISSAGEQQGQSESDPRPYRHLDLQA